ncbi:F-box domain-containing protein [Mycena sanguinolenta]|uniref:F-box domain-containing protein n=1 Tax=Mycena sanguinolenta TaxID=230812 RepID=A0A8H6Y6F7_9AGAR|nr:F-box domain-containing protein [Mycena sanguinolenta]
MASPSNQVSLAENHLPCYISSIPPEILSQIMLMCDRDLTIWDETRYLLPARHNIPVRLTQICSSWRMVALDTPELWSSVMLVLAQNTSAIIKLADYWLAKGQRGRLGLEFDVGVTDERRIDLEPIGRLLTAWASDWRTLTIVNCSDSMAEYVIANMAQNPHPSLEEFELHAFSTVWHTRFEALAALPRLRTVTFRTWRSPSTHHNLSLLFLPWSQLESVSISAPVSGQKCLDVLRNCPKLTTLELYVMSDVPTPEFRPPSGALEVVTTPGRNSCNCLG